MNLFYIPQGLNGNHGVLDEEESKHCIRVLRLQPGDEIDITDGKGFFYKAQIAGTSPKHCEIITVSTTESAKSNNSIHIAIAPTKNINRLEWFMEKSTEMGITAITPVYSRYSERKAIKPERLEKILVSAMKQSLKAFLPTLHQEINFKNFIEQDFADAEKYIAYYGSYDKKLLQKEYTPNKDVIIMIGPEGGYEEKEVEQAVQKGFIPVSLGPSRLRTETAGIVACHTIHLINDINIYNAE